MDVEQTPKRKTRRLKLNEAHDVRWQLTIFLCHFWIFILSWSSDRQLIWRSSASFFSITCHLKLLTAFIEKINISMITYIFTWTKSNGTKEAKKNPLFQSYFVMPTELISGPTAVVNKSLLGQSDRKTGTPQVAPVSFTLQSYPIQWELL